MKLGLGIIIVAKMAYQPEEDSELAALDVSHLFRSSTTKIGFRKGTFLRGFMYEFIEEFAPHLTKDVLNEAFKRNSKIELDELFSGVELPVY